MQLAEPLGFKAKPSSPIKNVRREMYLLTCISALLFIIMFASLRNGKTTISPLVLVQCLALAASAYFLTIFSISGIFSELFGPVYFDFIRTDSQRYIYEANLFSQNILSLNEISGKFSNYSETPKFGFSSLLAIYALFIGRLSAEVGLLLMNMTWLCMAVYFAYLINGILTISCIRKRLRVFFIFAILFFPLDYYWNLLLLREAIANMLLLTCLAAYYYSSLNKRIHYPVALILCLVLILFRSQMGMIAALSLFCIWAGNSKPGWLSFWAIVSLFLLASAQAFRASGLVLLYQFLDSVSLNAVTGSFWLLRNGVVLSEVLFWSVVSCAICSVFIAKERLYAFRPNLYFWGGMVILLVFLSALFLGFQIRFLYPLFLLIKIYALFFYSSRKLERGVRTDKKYAQRPLVAYAKPLEAGS